MIVQDSSVKLRRRDLLAYGAGLALLPSFSWAGRQGPGALAIGYCPVMGGAGNLTEELPAVDVVAASHLAAGETLLAQHGARITVHGLLGNARRLARFGIRSAELQIGFPAPGVEAAAVEFRAWSHQLLPVENAGPANAFTVPIDRGLPLALELEAVGTERFETRLVTDREPGAPKLRTGLYLIAPGTSTFRVQRYEPTGPEPLIAFSVELLDQDAA